MKSLERWPDYAATNWRGNYSSIRSYAKCFVGVCDQVDVDSLGTGTLRRLPEPHALGPTLSGEMFGSGGPPKLKPSALPSLAGRLWHRRNQVPARYLAGGSLHGKYARRQTRIVVQSSYYYVAQKGAEFSSLSVIVLDTSSTLGVQIQGNNMAISMSILWT